MYDGLLLDLDGTLADSIRGLKETFFEFSDYFDLDLSDVDFLEFNGPTISEIVRKIQISLAPTLPPQLMINKYYELLQSKYLESKPTPGAKRLIEKANSLGQKVAIVTSNTRSLTMSWLRKYEMENLFQFLVTCNDVQFGKPHPQPYQLAIKLTDIPRTRLLAVEDSLQGAKSAIAAGLTTYLIGTNNKIDSNVNLKTTTNLISLYEILYGK